MRLCANAVLAVLCSALQLYPATGTSSLELGSRRLQAWPLPMRYPFDFPANVAESAKAAKKANTFDAYAEHQCKAIADPKSQGTRQFKDMNVPLWPMINNVARAAYIYTQDVVDLWADVFAKCNSMGGMAAEGVGYGIAFVYAEGLVESLGITEILESAYKKAQEQSGDGCKAVNNILDVAAAVIKARDTAADELFLVMPTYSKQLGRCTPRDKEQQFKPYSIRGSLAVDKRKVQAPASNIDGRRL